MSQEGRSVFNSRRTEMCPACLDREAIDLLGRPRYIRGVPQTFGCEPCGGTGRVPVLSTRDPYELVGGEYAVLIARLSRRRSFK